MKCTIKHKVFSFLMALLVMFSTVSFTVEKHFCGDILIDVAVFTEPQKCCDETSETEIDEKLINNHCCKDVLEVVEGQDHLKITKLEDIPLEQQVFLASFIYSYALSFQELPKLVIPHKNYSPPDLIKDIVILDEVFLI